MNIGQNGKGIEKDEAPETNFRPHQKVFPMGFLNGRFKVEEGFDLSKDLSRGRNLETDITHKRD